MKCAVEKLAMYVPPTAQVKDPAMTDVIASLATINSDIDVSWVKPMQRRRLSLFAKMALSCANMVNTDAHAMPVVFSSRHGDLHKTSDLLEQLVEQQPLSPTQFGLSVHNAVSGLLSILTNNTAAVSAIAGGRSTFSSALIEAYLQLHSGDTERVLLLHVDRALPDIYAQYADEEQVDHCVALVLKKNINGHGYDLQELLDAQPEPSLSALRFAHAAIHNQSIDVGKWRWHYAQ